MNILVYNLAAEYAGAMTILENFYNQVVAYPDENIHWYFVVSTKKLESKKNVTVISEPWVKRSWLHRLYYDNFVIQRIVKEKKIDVIYSMQNMPVKKKDAKQVVYLHQSLQFSPVKFSLFDKEQRGYAIRQKLVCNIYRRNLKHADGIIVQTNWFKDAVVKWIPFDEKKIKVVHPRVSIEKRLLEKKYTLEKPVFFYPAGDGMHKNHEVIVNACKRLQDEGINDYTVIFTLDRKTALYSERIAQRVEKEKLNIRFTGIIPKQEVFEYYSQSVLLFPSYLETFGLPMLEARMMKAIVFASDMPFCHEALENYKNAYYFAIDDDKELAKLMKMVIKGELSYYEVNETFESEDKKTEIECLLEYC